MLRNLLAESWESAGTLRDMCFKKCWSPAQALNQAGITPPFTTQPAVQQNFTVTVGNANGHPIIFPFLFGNTLATFLPSLVILYSLFSQ